MALGGRPALEVPFFSASNRFHLCGLNFGETSASTRHATTPSHINLSLIQEGIKPQLFDDSNFHDMNRKQPNIMCQ